MFCVCFSPSNPFVSNPAALGNTLLQSSSGRRLLVTVFTFGCLGILADKRARVIEIIAALANALLPRISRPPEEDFSSDPHLGARRPSEELPSLGAPDGVPSSPYKSSVGAGAGPADDFVPLPSARPRGTQSIRSLRTTPRIVPLTPSHPPQTRSWFWWVPSWPGSRT